MDAENEFYSSTIPAKDINALWEEAKLTVSKDISAISFDVWIKTLEPVKLEGDTFVLAASSLSGKSAIVKNEVFYNSILGALAELDPSISKIELTVSSKEPKETPGAST